LQKAKTVKGTKDLLGNDIVAHEYINKIFKETCFRFNFEQISTPILEHSEIFTKSLGLSSDIVSKEMYNFIDQGNDSLVLRPEGTAAVARAIITNSLDQNSFNKYFYYGPMFRRERPQSGRLRQFHQIGIEYLGLTNFLNDLEVILIAERLLDNIGIRKKLVLEINTLGNVQSRKSYNSALRKFLEDNENNLSDQSKERLKKNPLRVLDSKNSKDQELLANSPDIRQYLDKESSDFFNNLINGLKKLQIDFKVNPFLVRGLDYYNHTAFEYVTKEKKSQNAVLAGGRYDGLVEGLGGPDLAGVGWAAGIERIILNLDNSTKSSRRIICFFSTNENLDLELLRIVKNTRLHNMYNLNIISSGSLKKKFSKANKIGAYGCVVLGEDEWQKKKVLWKNLSTGKQELIDFNNIEVFFNKASLRN
jgi:histidyl-tRNA synthetase